MKKIGMKTKDFFNSIFEYQHDSRARLLKHNIANDNFEVLAKSNWTSISNRL